MVVFALQIAAFQAALSYSVGHQFQNFENPYKNSEKCAVQILVSRNQNELTNIHLVQKCHKNPKTFWSSDFCRFGRIRKAGQTVRPWLRRSDANPSVKAFSTPRGCSKCLQPETRQSQWRVSCFYTHIIARFFIDAKHLCDR